MTPIETALLVALIPWFVCGVLVLCALLVVFAAFVRAVWQSFSAKMQENKQAARKGVN